MVVIYGEAIVGYHPDQYAEAIEWGRRRIMNSEARKASLRFLFTRVVEPLGYSSTPDDELADFLLEQEVKLEGKLGSPFCPCQGRTRGARRHEDRRARASRITASISTP